MKYDEGDMVEVIGKTADGKHAPLGAQGKVLMVHPKNYYEILIRDENGKVAWVSTINGENLALAKGLKHTA